MHLKKARCSIYWSRPAEKKRDITPHIVLGSQYECIVEDLRYGLTKNLDRAFFQRKQSLYYTHAHIKLCNHSNTRRQAAKRWTCQQRRLIYMLITPPTVTNIHPIKSSSHPSGPHTVHQMEVWQPVLPTVLMHPLIHSSSINRASLDVKLFSSLSFLI